MVDIKADSTAAILKRLVSSCAPQNIAQAVLETEKSPVADEPSDSPQATPNMPHILTNCFSSTDKNEKDLGS